MEGVHYSIETSPSGKRLYVFEVKVTQVDFGNYGGTCRFYVALKDASGRFYFGSGSCYQGTWPLSKRYSATYRLRFNIEGLAQPAVFAYATLLEIDGKILKERSQNITDSRTFITANEGKPTLAFDSCSYSYYDNGD